jgi:hypothetical protein
MNMIRPEIDEDLIRKIKMNYPTETWKLGNAETITWAVNKLLKAKLP